MGIWLKRIAIAGFWFYLIKGLIWLVVIGVGAVMVAGK